MAIGSWGQVGAVGGVLDIHLTASGRVGVSHLDERLIEKNLAKKFHSSHLRKASLRPVGDCCVPKAFSQRHLR